MPTAVKKNFKAGRSIAYRFDDYGFNLFILFYYRDRPDGEDGGPEGGGGRRGGAGGGRWRLALVVGGHRLGGGRPDRRAPVRPGRDGRRPGLQRLFYDDFVFAYSERPLFQTVFSERPGDRLAAVGGGGRARRRGGAGREEEAVGGGGGGGGGGGDWRDRPRKKLF